MNRKGLSTVPWCTPTLTVNALLSFPLCLTTVVDLSYNALITHTIHSATPSSLNAHHTTSRGTRSKAFSKSTNAIHRSWLFVRYFSCNCLTMNIAFVTVCLRNSTVCYATTCSL